MTVGWLELALFMVTIALAALYGLAISGHFPAEFRADDLKTRSGVLVMWMTLAVVGVSTLLALGIAIRILPWFAIVIGGGGMLLMAPLILRPFPDRFVNGRSALVAFAGGALAATIALWLLA